MKAVETTEFKDRCLELLEQLNAHDLIITQNEKPVAKVVLYREGPTELQLAVLNGSLCDKVKIHGDKFSTGIKWDAESGHPHSPLHH